jgi:hypothetical protein
MRMELAAIRHGQERISARRLEFGSAPMVLKAPKPTPQAPHPQAWPPSISPAAVTNAIGNG